MLAVVSRSALGLLARACKMDQLAPQALGALLRTHAILQQRADALSGSSLLSRAWRAWAALTKMRKQVELLGRHLQEWRTQQLQQERWLIEATRVLAITAPGAEGANATTASQRISSEVKALMDMGFSIEVSATALQKTGGSVERAASMLLSGKS